MQDGGPDLAIELMAKVIEELRELKKARRSKSFDEGSFREAQDQKRNLRQWGMFMNIHHVGEVPLEDD